MKMTHIRITTIAYFHTDTPNWQVLWDKEYLLNSLYKFIVCTPPLSAGGIEPPTKFSEKGDLTGPQFLEGSCWEEGGDFFQGGMQLSHKK